MKKFFVVFLVAMLVFTFGITLAAPAKKAIKFTVWMSNADQGALPQEDPVHKLIRENLGVDLQFEYCPSDADAKLNLMLASGDYPDAIFSKSSDTMNNYANNNHLVVLDKYLEKYFKKYAPDKYTWMVSDRENIQAVYDEKHKHFYHVPGGFGYTIDFPTINPLIGVRYDSWQKIGAPKPKTLDEFYEMAKKMQDATPQEDGKKTYAFSGWFGDSWGAIWMLHALDRYSGVTGWTEKIDTSKKYAVSYPAFSEASINSMRFYNRAYREGYADPETAVMKFDQYVNNKANQGLVLCPFTAGSWLEGGHNRARKAANKPEQRFFPYVYMNGTDSKSKALTGQYFPTGGGYNLYFTKNCKQAEEVFKRLAPMAGEKWQAILNVGIEDVHWTKDAKSFRKPTDEMMKLYETDTAWQAKTGVGKYNIFGYYYGGFDSKGDALTIGDNKYFKEKSYDEIDKSIFQAFKVTNYDDFARAGKTEGQWWMGAWNSFQEGTDFRVSQQRLNELIDEYISKLFLAKTPAEFDKLLEEWQKRAKAVGVEKLYEEMNKRIQASATKHAKAIKPLL